MKMRLMAFAAFAALVLSTNVTHAMTATATGADCAEDVASPTTLPGFGSSACGQADNRDDVADIEFNTAPVGDDFYSLGLGGTLSFSISPDFTGPGAVFEVTFPSVHLEAVEIYVSGTGLLGSWILAETVSNNAGSPNVTSHAFTVAGIFSHIGFRDISTTIAGTRSTDGFDIAAFSVTPVPLPAALPLLGGALGLMGLLGWRRKRAAAA